MATHNNNAAGAIPLRLSLQEQTTTPRLRVMIMGDMYHSTINWGWGLPVSTVHSSAQDRLIKHIG
eukprot:scaffold157182_cov36-Cyclotella_meneghiniana.AAC.1